MTRRSLHTHWHWLFYFLPLLVLVCSVSSCSNSKYVAEDHYLLRRNKLKIKTDETVTKRGELTDQLTALIVQKPNTSSFGNFPYVPYKLWLYNARHDKYLTDSNRLADQLKAKDVEMPVVYDSLLRNRTAQFMRSYLINQGFFYAAISDTTRFKRRKAYVTYRINTGPKYLVNNTIEDIDDSTIKQLVEDHSYQTTIVKGLPFSNTMLEDERSRLANIMRNAGYFKFTQENIAFQLDTLNKAFLRDEENPFESAINFLALQKQRKKPTLDIHLIIRKNGEPNAYQKYRISRVNIYPDFQDRTDFRDSDLITKTINNITFRYHNYYLHEGVLLSHNFLIPGENYSQENYDRTINKLNELGLFQYVRVFAVEDTSVPTDRQLRYVLLLSPAKKFDYGINYEVSTGTLYTLGNDLSFNFRDRNLFHGANLLTISLNGGVELGHNSSVDQSYFDGFFLQSENAGANARIEFPKFLSPIRINSFKPYNQPRTIIGFGVNLLDRVTYFTLTNTVANVTYNWKQNSTNTWDLSPAFINILRLPHVSDTFQQRLDSNEFLRNSYKPNFIEGENLSFTFSDANRKYANRGYSYLKVSMEEAGALLSGISAITGIFKKPLDFDYSQYVKLDLDVRHYFRRPHSTLVTRFYGGYGLPYDKSSTLPYVKQYFSGGAYSIRGWRVRQLGPGSYFDSASLTKSNTIDRTGDIKMEGNIEYRFDIIQLFSGGIHMNGALFADGGNIWLARPSVDYPGGELALNTLYQDLAVSTGAGLRFDIGGIFVIRVDAAIPIKKPYIFANKGWVIKDIQFGDGTWRDQNLILNFAIGYPF